LEICADLEDWLGLAISIRDAELPIFDVDAVVFPEISPRINSEACGFFFE